MPITLENTMVEVKKTLANLKAQYEKNPNAAPLFDKNKMVHPDMMFFIVDHYMAQEKKLFTILQK